MSENILTVAEYHKYYENNIQNVISYITTNTGKAEIDPEKVKEWIQKQPTDESKQAAKDLFDNTKYYSLSNVFSEIRKLINEKYRQLIIKAKSNKTEIIMFIGKENKSNDYLSMLAYYHMIDLDLEVPSQYIRSIYDEILNHKKYIVVYLDDMAYSGGQTSGMMNQIMSAMLNEFIIDHLLEIQNKPKRVKGEEEKGIFRKLLSEFLYGKSFPEKSTLCQKLVEEVSNKNKEKLKNSIHFLFIGINKYSLERLNTRYYTHVKNGNGERSFSGFVGPKKIDTPEQAIYYNTKIPTLDEKLSGKRLFNLGYFFSFGVIPNVNVYFDHKIADDVSVFTRVLTLGPIVPENYCIFNYLNPDKFTKENLDHVIGNTDVFTKRFYDPMYEYYDDIKKCSKPQNIRKPLEFHPFLKECTGVQKIINHPYMKYINYLELINAKAGSTFFIDDIFYKLDFSEFDKEPKFVPKLDSIAYIVEDTPPVNYRRRKIDRATYEKIENFLIRLREDRCHITMYKNNYNYKTSSNVEPIEGSKSFIPWSVNKSYSKKIRSLSSSEPRSLSSSKTRKKKTTMNFKSANSI